LLIINYQLLIMLTEQTQKIMGYFIEEAKDHFNIIEQGLLNLWQTLEGPELLQELFRSAHCVIMF